MASTGATATSIALQTTLPRLPLAEFPVIQTQRLLLRSFTQDDLEALYALRKMPEFMAESSLGKADGDIAETQAALEDLLKSPKHHFIFGIFVAATGELIGDGGIHTIKGTSLGWPEIGYKLHPAHWGRGYATEAMGALLKAWWELPREGARVEVHPGTLLETEEGAGEKGEEEEGRIVSREHVVAEIAAYNNGSQRVLEKLGFRHFGSWEEPDTQLHRLGQPLLLGHYVLTRPA
ncbi:acetyltransferase domain-containing protein [Nemania sp. FL0031]|nr:acetyltransferase domain-containing protein [Nemania sp. FL0031]